MSVRFIDSLGNTQSASGSATARQTAYRDTGFTLPGMALNDTLFLTFQLNHDKRLGDPIKSLHLHFIPTAADGGHVAFAVKYFWATYNAEIPADSGWTTVSPNPERAIAVADQYKHRIITLASDLVAPTGEGYSSLLFASIKRVAPAGSSSYPTNAANILAAYADLHYPKDRDGSIFEYSDEPPGSI